MVTTERDYVNQAYTFLDQARQELEKDDLRQASEKGWGAAAQMAKAIAVRNGLEHTSHRHLWEVVNSLEDEQRNKEFGLASSLHVNFYEGWMAQEQVAQYLGDIATFVTSLDNAISANSH